VGKQVMHPVCDTRVGHIQTCFPCESDDQAFLAHTSCGVEDILSIATWSAGIDAVN